MNIATPACGTPLAHTLREVLRRVPVSRTTIYNEIASGRLRVTKVGRRTLVSDPALQAWLARCEAESVIDTASTAAAVAARAAARGEA
jgi:excisionase family DNA binding protein